MSVPWHFHARSRVTGYLCPIAVEIESQANRYAQNVGDLRTMLYSGVWGLHLEAPFFLAVIFRHQLTTHYFVSTPFWPLRLLPPALVLMH